MLREMEYVCAVCEEMSFSKAAKKLFISQPALSATIKKVESEIRTPIFDRSTNPVNLTEAGRFYIESARKIMAIQKEMDDYFASLAGEQAGEVNVGSSTYFCIYILPEIVNDFHKTCPGITVNFVEGSAPYLTEKLKDGSVDFVLDIEKLNENIFDEVVWDSETIILAVPSAFPVNRKLAGRGLSFEDVREGRHLLPQTKGVDLGLFADADFLLLKKGNDLHRRALAICKKFGFEPKGRMYLDQLLTCYHIACDGKGVAFVRDSMVRFVEETEKICFYKIDDGLARRTIKLFHRKPGLPAGSSAELFRYIRNRRITDPL